MPDPVLSIIIPTYNRCALLSKTLDSIARLKIPAPEVEVIVVDDGSQDGTEAMLRGRKDDYALRVFRHEKSKGPSAARNRGAREARGGILGFLDSDIEVQPGWWEAAQPHFADPAVAGVEGATVAPEGSPVPTPFTHVVANAKGGLFLTCNMLYRKDVFWSAGGFDERFLKANREDSDLGFSVLEQSRRIVFEPRAQVTHPLVPAPKNVYLKQTRYGVHEALLRRKHPQSYAAYLKWIDGRAFPVFYWGMFVGWPVALAGFLAGWPLVACAGIAMAGLGWAGSIYAVCRKRIVSGADLLVLAPQYLIIPWLRLFWVLVGEWKFRNIKPGRRFCAETLRKQ